MVFSIRTKKQRDVIIKCFYGQVRKLIRHKVSYDFNNDTDKALYDISLIYQYLYLCMANLDNFYRFLGGIIYSRNYIQWLCKLCPKSPSYTGILWSWLCFFQGTCNLALKKLIKKWKNNSIQVIFCYLQILIVILSKLPSCSCACLNFHLPF